MPKNTYFIKENYKKTEEVREIENHVPSLEEFLSKYNQEQMNYDDLIYNDISSSKIFGPMWSNSQYGERWVNLRIPCPVSGCSNRNVINQIHTCGGQIEISNKARVRCKSCGVATHVKYFSFRCSNHSEGRRQASSMSLANALSTAYGNGEISSDMLMEIIQELRANPWC